MLVGSGSRRLGHVWEELSPEHATEGLQLNAVVPPQIHGDDPIGGGEIQPLPAAFEACDHDLDRGGGLLEIPLRVVPRLRRHLAGVEEMRPLLFLT